MTLRPVHALQADLAAVLSEGRVVAGEVLATLDGRSVLVGIGTWRVPAESHVELDVGARFLARVEANGERIVLHLLRESAGEENPLLRALRSVVAFARPAGERLADLRTGLGAFAGGSGIATLLAELGDYSWKPGAGGAQLRELVERSGLLFEASIADAASPPAATADRAVLIEGAARSLATLLVELVKASARAAPRSNLPELVELESVLAELLLALGREGMPASGRGRPAEVGEILRWLQQRLEAESVRRPPGVIAASLRALAEIEPTELARGDLVRLLIGLAGGSRAIELHAVAAGARSKLVRDLKGRLLVLAHDPESGSAAAVAERALAGIESEQLINLARQECGQGRQVGIAVPDAAGWTTATIRIPPDPDRRKREEEEAPARAAPRIVLDVRFSRLGAVRADLLLSPRDLALRLSVAGPESLAHVQRAVEPLVAELEALGRSARVSVVVDPSLASSERTPTSDVRFLNEHHLMDLAG